jgi:16S rRNA (guanine527-N7)-methyltransferase
MKIVRPDLNITLLDSSNKRLTFLDDLCRTLVSRETITLVHGRAEDIAHLPAHREQYDIATARAVAKLSVLCEYCIPFVKTGGYFLAFKGDVDEELENATKAVHILKGEVSDVIKYNIGENRRSVVIIKKISQTLANYPRNPNQISKKPL